MRLLSLLVRRHRHGSRQMCLDCRTFSGARLSWCAARSRTSTRGNNEGPRLLDEALHETHAIIPGGGLLPGEERDLGLTRLVAPPALREIGCVAEPPCHTLAQGRLRRSRPRVEASPLGQLRVAG